VLENLKAKDVMTRRVSFAVIPAGMGYEKLIVLLRSAENG
jgi:hypothetical protein